MHFHQKSTNQLSNGIKALMLLLITYTTWCEAASLTSDEIADAFNVANLDLRSPGRFCGKRLTEAMKVYCIPRIRDMILRGEDSHSMAKKSMDNSEMDFDAFAIDGGLEDDEIARTRYRTIDDLFLSNDIPLLFPSQTNSRRRRGIIEECCRRSCFKRDLVKFCPIKG